jgi:hypothetical protein
MPGGPQVQPLALVFAFTVSGGKITAIDMAADPGRLRRLNLEIIDG